MTAMFLLGFLTGGAFCVVALSYAIPKRRFLA